MKRTHLIIIGLIIFLISGILAYYINYTGSPHYSVLMIFRSIKTHDWEGFQKYVSIDDVVENFIDIFADFVSEREGPKGKIGKLISKGIGDIVAPKISEEIEKQLKTFIEEDGDRETDKDIRKKLLSKSSIVCLKQEGKVAIMSVNIEDEEGDINIKLKMRRRDGHWQLVEIINPGDIVKSLLKIKNME